MLPEAKSPTHLDAFPQKEDATRVNSAMTTVDPNRAPCAGAAPRRRYLASAPLGFVSDLLFWLNVALAGILHAKRGELLAGHVGASNRYDEIGGDDNDNGRIFGGDFPSFSAGMRTMHV